MSNRTYLYLKSFGKWWHFSNSSRKSSLILPNVVTRCYLITALLIFKYWHKPICSGAEEFVCVLIRLLNVWRASVVTKGSPRYQILHGQFVFCSSMTSLQLCMAFLIVKILASFSCSSFFIIVFAFWVSHCHSCRWCFLGWNSGSPFLSSQTILSDESTFNYVVGLCFLKLVCWYLNMSVPSQNVNCFPFPEAWPIAKSKLWGNGWQYLVVIFKSNSIHHPQRTHIFHHWF